MKNKKEKGCTLIKITVWIAILGFIIAVGCLIRNMYFMVD